MPEFLRKCRSDPDGGYWYARDGIDRSWLPGHTVETVLILPQEVLTRVLDAVSLKSYLGTKLGTKQMEALLHIVMWRLRGD